MRALIVSPTTPPIPGRDVHGVYGRLGMEIRALGRVADSIEMLHLVHAKVAALYPDSDALGRIASAHWGVRVTVMLAPLRVREETMWRHYGAGIFSIRDQPRYFPYCGEVQIGAVEQCLDRSPDLVLVHRLDAMSPFLRLRRGLPPMLFDLDDVEHRVLMRSTFTAPVWPGKLAYLLQVPAMVAAERNGAGRSLNTFVCSEFDRLRLKRLGIVKGVVVIPNAIEIPAAVDPVASDRSILFLGAYNFPPNARGAERLVARIWPLVSRELPEARLVIAGKEPECIPSFRSPPPGVEFAGFVKDLTELYRRSRIVCAPLIEGGGTRVKLIEAAAYAKPVVSTTVGAEGLDFQNGSEIMIADRDAEIAAACVRLLRDDKLCQRLGSAARERARERHDRSKVQIRLETLMRDAIGKSGAARQVAGSAIGNETTH